LKLNIWKASSIRRRTIVSSILIATVLTLSTFAARPVFAANPPVPPGQWVGSEGVYPYNWDYANQTDVSAANVNQLQVSWIYPVPSTPLQYLPNNPYTTTPLGITFTGTMVNGIVYTMTEYSLIQANNGHTGSLIWQDELPGLKFSCMHNQLHVPGANATGHYHNIWYTSGVKGVWANTPMIWMMSANHTAFAYNALTGAPLTSWQTYNPCATFANGATGVPGNFGLFDTTTQNTVIDAARGILVTGSSAGEGTDAGRGFFVGYNISVNPPKLLWTTFISPPQDGSNPNWDISDVQNMTNAWIWDATTGSAVNLKTLSATDAHNMLYDDWGYASGVDFNHGKSWSGVGTGWGGNWALDTTTGNAFVATAEPSDYPNASLRPGPNLWADSVLSVNDQNGKVNWAFQGIPHDLADQDCAWTDMLATITSNGQPTLAVIKTCKSGDMWALSAATGAVLWHFFPGPSDMGYNGLPNSVCSGAGSCSLGYSGAGSKFKAAIPVPKYGHALSPLNRSEMTRGWPNYPSKQPFLYYPNSAGPTESNAAYDPTTNLIFYNTYSSPSNSSAGIISGAKGTWGGSPVGTLPTTPLDVGSTTNDTLWALNANTGVPIWTDFIPLLGLRGGVSVTNGLVLVPLVNSSLLFINEKTGALLRDLFLGSGLVTQPIIGTDISGKTQIVLPGEIPISKGVYVGENRSVSSPGLLIGIALGPGGPTTTSVVTGSPSTTTTTTTSQVTTTGPTTTISKGIDPTTFYAVAGIAVVFIIVTGLLALRRRKPA